MLNDMVVINSNLKPENPFVVRQEGVITNVIHSQVFLFGDIDMSKSKFKRKDQAPICGCGHCGRRTKWNSSAKKYNRFITGHNRKGEDKYTDEKAKGAPICKCGHCNQKTIWCKQRKQWNEYIKNHSERSINWKPKPPDSEAPFCQCIEHCNQKTTWNRGKFKWNKYINGHGCKGRDKYAEKKAKEAPLCQCINNCGQRITWNRNTKQYNKYISGHCSIGKNTKITVFCAQCGKSKEIYPREQNKKHYFCNNQCHGEWKKINWQDKNNHNYIERIEIFCAQCNKPIKILPLEKRDNNFCNRECNGKWMSENLIGENSLAWQGGKSFEEYCVVWTDQEYQEYVLNRDNNECQNPDCRKNCNHLSMNRHHINYDKEDCHYKNIITICRSCNSRANGNRKYWTEFYQNIMTEKYGYKYD